MELSNVARNSQEKRLFRDHWQHCMRVHVDGSGYSLLKDGEIVTTNGVFKGGIAVQGDRITAITSSSSLPAASKVIDCDGLHILPGVIDAHVHFMDPGRPDREDFTTGSTAAAAGGDHPRHGYADDQPGRH